MSHQRCPKIGYKIPEKKMIKFDYIEIKYFS